MKKGSWLVNTARGAICDRQAVADAVASGHLNGYGGDVWGELLDADITRSVLTASRCSALAGEPPLEEDGQPSWSVICWSALCLLLI